MNPPPAAAKQRRRPCGALVVAGAAFGAATLFLGCQGQRAPAPSTEQAGSAAVVPPGLSDPAFQAYKAATQSIWAGDVGEGRRHLEVAVEAQPDFTEAWYNLGAATTRLAIDAAAAGQDTQAVALFREAVGQKTRAKGLIAEGKWFVYKTPQEQEQVISDLQHALEDADEVLADEASLLAALKLWGAARR